MIIRLLWFVLFAAPAAAWSQSETCIGCHEEASAQLTGDVHTARNLSCVNCHGGNGSETEPERAMDPRKGFIGKPAPAEVANFCGKCHSNADLMKTYNPSLRVDQTREYATSVHGKLAAKGDLKAATCISCHGSHSIRAVSDPNASVFPSAVAETCGGCHVEEAAKYHTSVHADALLVKQDLTAPTCNDCHGNHGAAPPGVASVANVCGTCHSRQADLFKKSPHEAAFETLGVGQCLACHNNHDVSRPTDEMLGAAPKATCVQCHSEGDAGFEAARMMRQDIDDLSSHFTAAEALLNRAARAGMEVSRAKFELTGARDKLIDARVIVHAFSAKDLSAATKPGMDIAMQGAAVGEQAMKDWLFRRKGLAASLIVIGLAIASIYFKLRELESNKSEKEKA